MNFIVIAGVIITAVGLIFLVLGLIQLVFGILLFILDRLRSKSSRDLEAALANLRQVPYKPGYVSALEGGCNAMIYGVIGSLLLAAGQFIFRAQ